MKLAHPIDYSLLPEPPAFDGPVCRGCFNLGTACGKCERCLWTLQQIAVEVRASTHDFSHVLLVEGALIERGDEAASIDRNRGIAWYGVRAGTRVLPGEIVRRRVEHNEFIGSKGESDAPGVHQSGSAAPGRKETA